MKRSRSRGGERLREGAELRRAGRKRASGRTNERTSISHRFWQEATGHFASWAARSPASPTRRGWRKTYRARGSQISRFGSVAVSTIRPTRGHPRTRPRPGETPGLMEADFGASGQVSSKLFISIIDEGGRYARAPTSSRRQLCHLAHHEAAWRWHQRLFTDRRVASVLLYFADFFFLRTYLQKIYMFTTTPKYAESSRNLRVDKEGVMQCP